MKRRSRTVALVAFLALLLALPGSVYAYRNFLVVPASPEPTSGTRRASRAPTFLFSFEGSRLDPMVRPVGVLADESGVYVVDSSRHTVDVFDDDGEFRSSFATSETAVPLYVARSPLDGNLYVSDRDQRSVLIFETDGDYVGAFDPRTSAETTGGPSRIDWAPVALDFSADGSLFVTDLLENHRVLKFAPAGILQRSVGGTETAEGPGSSPGTFAFPNGITVYEGQVYVADSNNGRIQVFDEDLEFQEITVTGGLPRGIDFLPTTTAAARREYVLVDGLSNDATIRSTDDDSIVQFADTGEARLSYPNGVSVMESTGRIYIADTARARVQVWGWESSDRSAASNGFSWLAMAILAALPLLPLLVLTRRQRVLATADFLEAVMAAGAGGLLGRRPYRWLVAERDRAGIVASYPELQDVLWPVPFESETHDSGLEWLVASARRIGALATESDALAGSAASQGVEVFDAKQFLRTREQGIVE